LLEELHRLYDAAGQPAARVIARLTRDPAFSEIVSHETVSSLLRGDSLPAWKKVEAVTEVLHELSALGVGTEGVLRSIRLLWLSAENTWLRPEPPPPASPALPDFLSGLTAPALACHAALPAVIDSAFLHLLRVNFFADPPHVLPYEVEADLLLSPLFTELAGDLYEMKPKVRATLLRELVSRFGEERLQQVAALLDHYTAGNQQWRDNPELAYAQHMTALAVRNPALARRRLDEAERAARAGGTLQREWYVAMHHHLDEQTAAATPEPKRKDLALSAALLVDLQPMNRDGKVARARPTRSMEQLRTILTDPERGGLPESACTVQSSVSLDMSAVERLFDPAVETLLVYVASSSKESNRLPRSLSVLGEVLEACPAKHVILIVYDSNPLSRAPWPLTGFRRRGWCVITFRPQSPDAMNRFFFTRALTEVLTTGQGPLTVGQLHRELTDRTSALGLPPPGFEAAPSGQRDGVEDVVLVASRTAARSDVSREEQRWLDALADYEQTDDLAGVARCHLHLGELTHERGDLDTATAHHELAITAYRQLASTDPDTFLPDLAKSLWLLAEMQADVDFRAESPSRAQEALQLYRQLAAEDPATFLPDLAMVLTNLSLRLAARGRLAEASSAIAEATDLFRELATEDASAYLPHLARSLTNMSNQQALLGDYMAALHTITEAVAVRRQLAEDDPAAVLPGLAGALENLSQRQSQIGHIQAAVDAIEEAVHLHRQLAAADPTASLPGLAGSLINFAFRLVEQGRPERALAAVEEGAGIFRQLAHTDPAAFRPNLATSLWAYARVCLDMDADLLPSAMSALQEAIDLYRQLSEQRPEAFRGELESAYQVLADVLDRLGRGDEASEIRQLLDPEAGDSAPA
jgi:tetratricopeptide (TPR) repeat protein